MSALRSSLPFLILAATACIGDAPAESAVEVIDSAGVRIVVNPAPDSTTPTFSLSADPLATIGVTDGSPEYQLFRVNSGRRLSDGTIVVANAGTFELRFYATDGTHLRSVGGEGEGPGEFKGLTVVGVLADDSVLVSDNSRRRYSIFDRRGTFARSYPVPSEIPSFLAATVGVLADGRVVVKEDGSIPRGPEDMLSPEGIFRRPDLISTIKPDGAYGARVGEVPGTEVSFKGMGNARTTFGVVFGRGAHAAAGGDRIVIATNETYSLPVYDGDGHLLQIVRQDRPPAPVREGDFERALPPALRPDAPPNPNPPPFLQRMRSHLDGMPRHTTLPAFGSGGVGSALRFAADGTLWVAEYEIAPDGTRPRWQAFDRDGMLLGSLRLPDGFVLFDFGQDWVLGRQTDEMDVERVVLYGMTAPSPTP